jgi:arylsulfatase A-like enzyme
MKYQLFAFIAMPLFFASYSSAADKMNVLFIAVDDLRTEFGAYDRPNIHAPNLDRLAKSGITFNRAYCQQAVCGPTRASLMTGARPDTTKVYDLETHFRKAMPDVVTLPQLFKQNGYFVQAMGKIYHSGLDDEPSWSVPWTSPKIASSTYGLKENNEIVNQRKAESKAAVAAGKKPNRRDYGPAFESSDVPDNTFHDGVLADMAVSTLQELSKKDQPFWLGVGFIRPHLPFVAPQKYWDLYDPKEIKLATNPTAPKDAPKYALNDFGELRTYHGIPQSGPIPDEMARQLIHGYYASISYMDAQLGRVLDELDRLGLRENTIIILWGDHGWKLGEHGSWCKHTNVENDTHAPLLISVPKLGTAGQRSDALVEFVDIYPSLAELCGLPLPKHLEGTSFAPLLKNPKLPWKTAAFSQYPRGKGKEKLMGYTMRTERYRFTRWVNENDHTKVDSEELYDHQNDPQENTNIAADPKNKELVAELIKQWNMGWRGALPPR